MLKKTLLAYTIGFAFSPPANADGIEIAAVDFDAATTPSRPATRKSLLAAISSVVPIWW